MAWRLARSLEVLRAEVDVAFPQRSKISDGTIGDAAHSARTSDHNPDGDGVVCAWDCTKDDALNVTQLVVDHILATKPRQVKYLIWEGHIYSGEGQAHPAWQPRRYTGSNGHYRHVHISVRQQFKDDPSSWGFTGEAPTPPPAQEDDMFTDEDRAMLKALHDDYAVKGKGVRQVIVEIKAAAERLAKKFGVHAGG
jgi:hypothetical protein